MTKLARAIQVLIIDDERDFADAQAEYLVGQGYETSAVYTLASALEHLKDSGPKVNIALIDMYMGRDTEAGLKLVRLMSKQYPWIVPIVVTGHGVLDNAAKCMQAGAFSYIQKGASPQDLITETLKKAVEKCRMRSRWATIRPSVIEIKKVSEEIRQRAHDMEEMLLRITDEVDVESDSSEAANEPDEKAFRQAGSK